MLFRRNVTRSCAYCANGTQLNENTVLCVRKGIVDIDRSCLKFKYDPCKRIPLKAKTPGFDKYDEDTFKL